MTCQDCKNYEECNKQKKIMFEIYADGWMDKPHLCTYVDTICQRFKERVMKIDG